MNANNGQYQTAEIEALKTAVIDAVALKTTGNIEGCIAALQAIVAAHPRYVAAHLALGEAYLPAQNWIEAAKHIGLVCLLDPDDYKAVVTLKSICSKLALSEAGRDLNILSERARARNHISVPPFRHFFDNGVLLLESFDYQSAEIELVKALEIDPADGPAKIALAVCYQELGQSADTLEILQSAVANGSENSWRAVIELARLSHHLSADERDNYIAVLARQIELAGDPKFDLSLAQATYHHSAQRPEQAWQIIARVGQEMKPHRKMENFQVSKQEKAILAHLQNLESPVLPDRSALSFTPVFILGTSRSGKTMIERFLGQVSGVKKGYENHLLGDAVVRANHLDGRISSSNLSQLPIGLFAAFCTLFIDKMSEKAGDTAFFTTTNPGYIGDLGSILECVPQARIILVKRDPADTVIRMLLHSYEAGNAYAYDPVWAHDHVVRYHQLIDFWQERFPDNVRIVHYEEIVATPERTLGELLAFTGIGAEKIGEIDLEIFDDRGVAGPYAAWLEI